MLVMGKCPALNEVKTMTSIIILGVLSVAIFMAHWRKNKVAMMIIAIVIFSILLFQLWLIVPSIRSLADRQIPDDIDVKSYFKGARDAIEYVRKLRWFVLSEAFLLFLIAAL